MSKVKLCDINNCTQCLACTLACPKGCIKMIDSGQGFTIPWIDDRLCIDCGACLQACHQIAKKVSLYSPIKTYACWTNIFSDRKRSSSGGAFSVIARTILNKKGVVYGATMNECLQVSHIAIEKPADLYRLQGSKYVQSYLGNSFQQIRRQLCDGRLVLFTGTPCQVAGLLTFLRKKYDNLITCDIICHGVPSQKIFDKYCSRTKLIGNCDGVSFRFTEGWGFQLSKEYLTEVRGQSYIKRKTIWPNKAWYMRAFNKSMIFSDACYNCNYSHPERVSDFTLGDFWGLGTNVPFRHSTRHGVSLLLVNTQKALNLMADFDNFSYEERELQEAINGNYNLSHQSPRPDYRDSFIKDLFDENNKEIVNTYGLKASCRDYLRLIKQAINRLR